MRLKPHVDAFDVEAVVAFREQSALLVALELAQTDGALEPLFVIFRLIDEHGNCFYGRLAEAASLEPRGILLADKEQTTASERTPASPDAARVEMQTQDKENHCEQNYDGYQHDFAAYDNRRGIIPCITIEIMAVRIHGWIRIRHRKRSGALAVIL